MYDDQMDDQGEWARYNWFPQEPQAPPPSAGPGYAPWTDPDTAPPNLGDQNQQPQGNPGPGNYWAWNGSAWEIRMSPRANQPATTPPPTVGGDNPYTYHGYDGGDRGGGGGGGFDPSGFSWPQWNAPSFAGPKDPFTFEAFKAPDFNDIRKDPSYIGRRDEGLQAIEHGAAAKGLTRLPSTLKALGSWNQDFASREYGNIFDRSANTWSMNRNNAADNYSKNYGISRDVFDRNYQGSKDSFDMNAFQPAKMTFDDLFRRYKAELDSTTALALGGDT